MVTTLRVRENGDLELPPKPRRRLRIISRNGQRDMSTIVIPTELQRSKLVA